MRKVNRWALYAFMLLPGQLEAQTTIKWSGFEWVVKASNEPQGPGYNLWSDSKKSVWIDSRNRLHLKIRKINDIWHCAEVYTAKSLGYGKYLFYLDSRVDNLDKNVVVGLFTHMDDTREMDIEFSKWGQDRKHTYHQFVIQPRTDGSKLERSDYKMRQTYTTHGLVWMEKGVGFRSYAGHQIRGKRPYKAWDYTGADKPKPSTEKVHINLWLYRGQIPSDRQEVELIVRRFVFIPLRSRLKQSAATVVYPQASAARWEPALGTGRSGLWPHNNLTFKDKSTVGADGVLDVLENRQHIMRCAVTVRNNEIGMLGRDLSATDAKAFKASAVN